MAARWRWAVSAASCALLVCGCTSRERSGTWTRASMYALARSADGWQKGASKDAGLELARTAGLAAQLGHKRQAREWLRAAVRLQAGQGAVSPEFAGEAVDVLGSRAEPLVEQAVLSPPEARYINAPSSTEVLGRFADAAPRGALALARSAKHDRAEALAAVAVASASRDPEVALSAVEEAGRLLLASVREEEANALRARVAYRLADLDPGRARSLLRQTPSRGARQETLEAIVSAYGKLEPSRALAVIAGITDPRTKSRLLATLARQVPGRAREYLGEATTELMRALASQPDTGTLEAAALLGSQLEMTRMTSRADALLTAAAREARATVPADSGGLAQRHAGACIALACALVSRQPRRAFDLLSLGIASLKEGAHGDVYLSSVAGILAGVSPRLGRRLDDLWQGAGAATLFAMSQEAASKDPSQARAWLRKASTLMPPKGDETSEPRFHALMEQAAAQGTLLDSPQTALNTARAVTDRGFRSAVYRRLACVFHERASNRHATLDQEQAVEAIIEANHALLGR